jgi:hypothetical protein
MANANLVLIFVTILIFAVGYFVGRASIPKIYGVSEGFVPINESEKVTLTGEPSANEYNKNFGDNAEGFSSDVPDPDKYVLRSTIPPCSPCPDMSKYMLKTECPAAVDMSKYVLKSSVPKCEPCICASPKPAKVGSCPPPQRCPVCPPPPEQKPCPACPEVVVKPCAEPKINCKAEYKPESAPRPLLASINAFGY